MRNHWPPSENMNGCYERRTFTDWIGGISSGPSRKLEREQEMIESIRRALVSGALGVAMMTAPLVASADIYRYEDENGHRHAVGSLSQVPPKFRDAAISDLRERKSHGSVSRVTNDGSAPAAPRATSTAASAGTAAETDRIGGHDRYWWQSQMHSSQQRIAELKREIEIAKAEENDYTDKVLRKPGKGGAGHPARPGNRRRAAVLSSGSYEDEPSVEELEAQLVTHERDLDQFETHARQSSVPPGWLR